MCIRDSLLNKAQTVDRGQYTSASLSRLDNEIEKAKTVLSVENATQEQLNEAYTDLYQEMCIRDSHTPVQWNTPSRLPLQCE